MQPGRAAGTRRGNVVVFLVFPENSDMTSFSGLIIPRFKALCCHNFVLVKIVVTYASLFFGALQKISGMPLVFGMENASDEPRCRCFLRMSAKNSDIRSGRDPPSLYGRTMKWKLLSYFRQADDSNNNYTITTLQMAIFPCSVIIDRSKILK